MVNPSTGNKQMFNFTGNTFEVALSNDEHDIRGEFDTLREARKCLSKQIDNCKIVEKIYDNGKLIAEFVTHPQRMR